MEEQGKKIEKSDWMSSLIRFSAKYIPDAFPMVVVLTVIAAVLAGTLAESSPTTVAQSWYDGFWGMLEFTMQVSYLMLTGYLVADTPLLKKANVWIANIPKTTPQAVGLYFIIIVAANYCHFFIALAIAVMLGKTMIVEQHKKGNEIPYSMFVAIGCIGILFTCGLTPGTPLIVATSGHFMEEYMGVLPLTETMLIPQVIIMNVIMAVILLVIFVKMTPIGLRYGGCPKAMLEVFEKESKETDESAALKKRSKSFAEFVDNLPVIQMFLAIVGLIVVVINLILHGMDAFNMNSINFSLLMIAMLLHRTPANLVESARRGISSTYGIILQYPFYAGIFGIIEYTGLGAIISEFFISVAPVRFYSFIVWAFTALLNLFVPSGGTQFMVEAPYIIPSAIEMGVDSAYIVNAFTMGDVITNLIQPFWTIPIVSVFGLKFRDVYPYMLIAFVVGVIVMGGTLLFWMY